MKSGTIVKREGSLIFYDENDPLVYDSDLDWLSDSHGCYAVVKCDESRGFQIVILSENEWEGNTNIWNYFYNNLVDDDKYLLNCGMRDMEEGVLFLGGITQQ